MNKPLIKIDIVSDVVCPWCYIGKRRLEKAIDQLKEQYEFQLNYLPFELNPHTPKEGFDYKEHLSEKFGGEERFEQITDNTARVAASEGLEFNLSIQKKAPNTFDAHRIIWFAAREGKQIRAVELFFKSFFTEGIDLTKKENLLEIAKKADLDVAKVEQFLLSEEGKSEVKAMEKHAQSIGVSGVPFYIINNKYAVSGAQPTDVFLEALPDIAVKAPVGGESCDIEGNC
jgi:predicted DsbA family dithiol-disulfide isomerase